MHSPSQPPAAVDPNPAGEPGAAQTGDGLAATPAGKSGVERLLAYAKLLMGFGILGLVLTQVDWAQLAGMRDRFNPGLLLAMYAVTVAMAASCVWKWQALLRVMGVRAGAYRLNVLYWVGLLYQQVLPTSAGGDVIKIAILGRETGQTAAVAAATVAERMFGLIMLALIAVIGFAVTPALWQHPLLLVACIAAILFYGAAVGVMAVPLVRKLMVRLLGPRKIVTKIDAKAEEFQNSMALIRREPRVIWLAIGLSALFNLGTILTVALGCAVLGLWVDPWTLLVTVPIVLMVASLPISMNGIGLREWAFLVAFGAMGASGEVGLAASMIIRVVNITTSALFYLLYLIPQKRQAS